MKEILEALGTRIRSPLFGYMALAFFAINWKELLYLWLSDEDISNRIEFFTNNTSNLSLLIYPIILGIACAIIYPWVHLVFLRMAYKPTYLRNILQAETEHSMLLKKQELEALRNKMLTQKEENLIEQAKRDQEISQIENEELRQKLQMEVEKLRSERDQLAHSKSMSTGTAFDYKQVKDLIDLYQKRAEEAKKDYNNSKAEEYWKKAEALQFQLAEKALNSNIK